MKKTAILLTVFALMTAASATDIWTEVYSSGGYTAFEQKVWVGGLDWSEGAKTTDPGDYVYPPVPRMTAYINEGFENTGNIYAFQGMTSNAAWELEMRTDISGEGDTNLFKEVLVWTEDKKVDCQTGKLVYPTEAWVETEFTTPKPFQDAQSWHVVMDEPPAKDDVDQETGNYAVFTKTISTDEDFNYAQKVGVNNFPSDYVVPKIPEFPEMHWIVDNVI